MNPRYIARHPMTASRALGDEMIVISGGDSRLFTLNDVGALIWNAADGAASLEEIRDRICADFDVDAGTASGDLEAFVDALIREGILVGSDRPVPAGSEAP